MNTPEVMAYLEAHALAADDALLPPPSVLPESLIQICDDYLSGKVSDDDLQEIARVMLQRPDRAANRNDGDPEYDYGDRVERALYEWYAPEIYFPVTPPNIRLIRGFLAGGDWKPMTKS